MNLNQASLLKLMMCFSLIGALFISGCENGNLKDSTSEAPVSESSLSYQDLSKHDNIELDPEIWAIHQDVKGNHWFGSKNNGLFRYNGKELLHYC